MAGAHQMEDTGISEIIINTEPEGRYGVGRPKLRWLDDIEADIKTLGIKTKSSRQKRMDNNSKEG
jgi:hypothetical protein